MDCPNSSRGRYDGFLVLYGDGRGGNWGGCCWDGRVGDEVEDGHSKEDVTITINWVAGREREEDELNEVNKKREEDGLSDDKDKWEKEESGCKDNEDGQEEEEADKNEQDANVVSDTASSRMF